MRIPFSLRKGNLIAIASVLTIGIFFLLSSHGSTPLDLAEANKFTNEASNIFGLRSTNDELSQKIEAMTDKLLKQQEKRLAKIEAENAKLEKQLNDIRKPSSDMTLREKLAFVYPYDQKSKFPAYIWQTWKYGLNDERFGEAYKRGEEQWAVKNPGFVHELFNDDTANAIIRYLYMNIPEVIRVYELLPHVLLKMDFFRYLILFAKGGIYADVDTLPLQPIPNWIPENVVPTELGLVVGIESDPITKDWRKFYTRRLQFGNWVIQAKPGHPVLREMIANVVETTLTRLADDKLLALDEDSTDFLLQVMDWSGDGAWTDVVFKYFNDYVLSGVFSKVTWKEFTKMEVPKLVSDVLVMPVMSFSGIEDPSAPENAVKGDETHPLAFVKHYKHRVYQQI
ncbi:alpha-1,6-mannosyltransferase [Martiniozyma asiatica (nom. inval.)]|nr:alpha-1,6-mannosyltransferase [Martiniozyma asiatica]